LGYRRKKRSKRSVKGGDSLERLFLVTLNDRVGEGCKKGGSRKKQPPEGVGGARATVTVGEKECNLFTLKTCSGVNQGRGKLAEEKESQASGTVGERGGEYVYKRLNH